MPHVRPSIADKRRAFHRLHQDGCFVLPNPWDVGSARYLQTLGFKALATTSSGFAWSHGHRDGAMSRDRVLDHLTEMVEATDLPINADFEHGFSPDAAGVADIIEQIDSDKMLLFASDYPHWQFDGDDAMPPHLPASIVSRMCADNPLETFPRLKLAA